MHFVFEIQLNMANFVFAKTSTFGQNGPNRHTEPIYDVNLANHA